jgi:hypothetical protein
LTRTQRQIEEHRQGNAVIEVRDPAGRPLAGVPIWVEQEGHEFLFGCAVPDPGTLSDADRGRYRARWEEVFNGPAAAEDALRVEVMDRIHLGNLRRQLDRLAAAGRPLDVHVSGQTVGMTELGEQESARRVAELYTLCFAHPAVRGIFWHGFRDGESDARGGGLLRHDLSPKPAYRVLQKLVGVIWHTRAASQTDAEGRFHFRGFFGSYRVGVMVGEGVAKVAFFSLQHQPGAAAPFLVEVG